jgi:hypothetical protein
MKVVVNRYSVDFHATPREQPPIPGATLEDHPFGLPPFEMRPIWTIDIQSLNDLFALIDREHVSLDLSRSGYWSGPDFQECGERLFGIALIDDHTWEDVDPRDRPIAIRRRD